MHIETKFLRLCRAVEIGDDPPIAADAIASRGLTLFNAWGGMKQAADYFPEFAARLEYPPDARNDMPISVVSFPRL
jgi:hypothetical protein